MTNSFQNSRRDLRERAFQALFNIEMGAELLAASQFAYGYDKVTGEDAQVLELPIFLLSLVTGVNNHKEELDNLISTHLKKGWSLERLTLTDKTLLRLGLLKSSILTKHQTVLH